MPNDYKKAFTQWLIENHISFTNADEHKFVFSDKSQIKCFDFFLQSAKIGTKLAKVYGRKFKNASLAKMTGFQSWLPAGDIDNLSNWQHLLNHEAVIVFVYELCLPDIELDGKITYDYNDKRYLFFIINFDDYKNDMKLRNLKWRTVTLSIADFRRHAILAEEFLQ